MRLDELDYDLPPALIAQAPPPHREDARLLVVERGSGRLDHRTIRDLPALLAPGDLLVVNDTRVLPARLHARRSTGGAVELLLLEGEADDTWDALVKTRGRPRPGEVLSIAGAPAVRLLEDRAGGHWRVAGIDADLPTVMARHGVMPLPPYIPRAADDERDGLDRARYQTTFAQRDGAVAAPTAGLHLTPRLFAQLGDRGIERATITLHVGLGTFAPVRTERLEDHPMHAEVYEVPAATADAIEATRARGGRVVAVGTTTVRALEASAGGAPTGRPRAETARTDLLIQPGHAFRCVDALLTNFHLPRSTLLALVYAFAGAALTRTAYAAAIRARYRFYSYGDAMLVHMPPAGSDTFASTP